jgi:hypothetical protein
VSTNLPGSAGEPEYLSFAGGARPARRGRRAALIAGVVLAAGGIAAGGWAVASLMSGGESASGAVPASAVGFVSVDLDPSAGQKIEAIRILNKFPAHKDELGLGSRDDLRRWMFDQLRQDGCAELDYAEDVEPWIGDRLALAAVPDREKGALPMVALQVSDEQAAAAAMTKLSACADDVDKARTERTGVAFVGDYMVLAETQGQADRFAAAAEEDALADDAQFQKWTEAVGDPGIVTMYLSADAPKALGDLERGWAGYGPASAPPAGSRMDGLTDSFRGMAGVLRFRDGGVEAELAGQGLPGAFDGFTGVGPGPVADLPDSTAVALSVGLSDGWLQRYLDTMNDAAGQDAVDQLLGEAEAATGLDLPQDAETLLGDGLALTVDSSLDAGATTDPAALPVGLRIEGDPARIMPVLDKLRAGLGPAADMLQVEQGDGAVALGLDPAYLHQLLEGGDLGQSDAFSRAVPRADKASGVVFVDFDAGDGWAQRLAESLSGGDPDASANVAPLDALGISGWVDDGDVAHGLFRLTTD